MSKPVIKILAISNVYCRLMHFEKQGDIELGHYHNHDHGTLVSSGSVLVEMLSDTEASVVSSKVFKAPSFVFIAKDKKHRLTSLEDNTVCVCIHAIRDVEGSILSPEFMVDERIYEPHLHTTGKENFFSYVESRLHGPGEPFTTKKPKE